MTERERFESWARQRWTHPEDFDQRIKAPSKYNNYEVQVAWEAWQERASLIAPSAPEESAVQTAARIMNVDLIRQRDELRINLDDHRALVFDLRKEVEKLRTKVAEMERQEPFDADSDVFRSAFEAALKAGNWPATRQGDGYRSPSTQIAWRIAFSTVNRLKLYLAPGAQPAPIVPECFSREDLEAVADGLNGYEKTVNVGNVTGEGDDHLESTTAYAARFIRAMLAAPKPEGE